MTYAPAPGTIYNQGAPVRPWAIPDVSVLILPETSYTVPDNSLLILDQVLGVMALELGSGAILTLDVNGVDVAYADNNNQTTQYLLIANFLYCQAADVLTLRWILTGSGGALSTLSVYAFGTLYGSGVL